MPDYCCDNKSIKADLFCAIFELREQRVTVSTFLIVVKASSLSQAFNMKSSTAQCRTVKCIVHAHWFFYQMDTHKSRGKLGEVEGEKKDYLHFILPFLIGNHRDLHFILNMDQTLVYFSMNAKQTLKLVGTKTIHIRTLTNNTKHATVAVMIAGDGAVLP